MNLNNTINYTTNRLIMENLMKNGSVTLEEAEFLNKLATEVITEAVNEMGQEVPDDDIMSEDQVSDDALGVAPMPEDQVSPEVPDSEKILTDEQGNEYIYNPVTGELDPVDTPSSEDLGNTPDNTLTDTPDDTLGDIPDDDLQESFIIAKKLLSL